MAGGWGMTTLLIETILNQDRDEYTLEFSIRSEQGLDRVVVELRKKGYMVIRAFLPNVDDSLKEILEWITGKG